MRENLQKALKQTKTPQSSNNFLLLFIFIMPPFFHCADFGIFKVPLPPLSGNLNLILLIIIAVLLIHKVNISKMLYVIKRLICALKNRAGNLWYLKNFSII
jgi:hypothetical protein